MFGFGSVYVWEGLFPGFEQEYQYTEAPDVDWKRIGLVWKDLWCGIPSSSTSLDELFPFAEVHRVAEVSNYGETLFVSVWHEDVFKLDVSMYDSSAMQVI